MSSGAFVDNFQILGNPDGPLKGLKFAAKDLFDVAGVPTGFGNPQWKATHPVPVQTSPCIQDLLSNGATLVGKTHMDELAYSLMGQNFHMGTPLNQLAPDRFPGGSSSGSASAVACGEVDFSLGSDTAGSVRIPASFCGILGIRTTHGVVSMEHSRPLSTRFDTVGWFATDPRVFKEVGTVLLPQKSVSSTPQEASQLNLLVCKDALDLLYEDSKAALLAATDVALAGFASVNHINLSKGVSGGSLSSWCGTFRTLQARQIWESHGSWIKETQPTFGPGVKERFEAAALVTDEQAARAEKEYLEINKHLQAILTGHHILCVPSAPGPAPLITSDEETLNDFRSRSLCLTCIAGLGGFPQVSLPLGQVEGAPIGLGLIGPQHSDSLLLDIAYSIMKRQNKCSDTS